MIPLLVIKWIR